MNGRDRRMNGDDEERQAAGPGRHDSCRSSSVLSDNLSPARSAEPAINIPAVVLALIASFIVVHIVREHLLSYLSERILLTYAAFIPARYFLQPDIVPGGWFAWIGSPFLHVFLHASWTHLIVNAVWLAAFGTPVARRIGALRFLGLFFTSAAAGAFTFLILSPENNAILIGASGGISGLMGAAIRLLYARGNSLDLNLSRDLSMIRPLTLAETFRSAGAMLFIALWLGGNLVFGLVASHALGASGEIAWQAHMGGFLAGLVLFGFFDQSHRLNEQDLSFPGQ